MPSPSHLTLINKLEEIWEKIITADYMVKSFASMIKRLWDGIDTGGGHIEGIRGTVDNYAGTDDD